MKKGKTEISVHDAITCISGFHTGETYPRPTCVKIYFEGNPVRWVQICEECWNKLDNTVRKQFKENKKNWDSTLTKIVEEYEIL